MVWRTRSRCVVNVTHGCTRILPKQRHRVCWFPAMQSQQKFKSLFLVGGLFWTIEGKGGRPMRELTRDLIAAVKREVRLRKRRNDAARTLNSSGYTSFDLAANVPVQASRVRHYVTAGEQSGEFSTLGSFVAAFEAWQEASARVDHLKQVRNQKIIDRVNAGFRQDDIAVEFGISQGLVSHVVNTKQEVPLV